MTQTTPSDIVVGNSDEQWYEVSLDYIYTLSDGKVVNRMLKFFVNEEQFKQYNQNTAALASV